MDVDEVEFSSFLTVVVLHVVSLLDYTNVRHEITKETLIRSSVVILCYLLSGSTTTSNRSYN